MLVKVEEFRDAGFLPVALRNFLANVGWSFGDDREKFTIEEALPRFELQDINPAPSRLPYSKLEWLNGQYIQEMPPEELAQAVRPFLERAGYTVSDEALLAIMPAMSVRLKRLSDAVEFLGFLGADEKQAPLAAGDLVHKKLPRERAGCLPRSARLRPRDRALRPPTIQDAFTPSASGAENGKAGPSWAKRVWRSPARKSRRRYLVDGRPRPERSLPAWKTPWPCCKLIPPVA